MHERSVNSERYDAMQKIRAARMLAAKLTGVPFAPVVLSRPTKSTFDYSPTGAVKIRENVYY